MDTDPEFSFVMDILECEDGYDICLIEDGVKMNVQISTSDLIEILKKLQEKASKDTKVLIEKTLIKKIKELEE